MHARVVTGGGGGPEKTIINSPRFLENQGYPMVCAYMRDPKDKYFSDLLERAEQKNATVLPVDDFGPFDWRVITRFNALVRQHQPAIWHAHEYKSNFVGMFARRAAPMRMVTTVHGWVQHTWKTPLYYGIDRICLRRYEHVVCVSQDIHADVLSLGVPEAKCTYIPNGIDTDEYQRTQDRGAVKERMGTDPARMVFGAVGRLSDEKGFHLLIESFARCQARVGTDAELWIVGEGAEKARLEKLITELGVANKVKLLGFRKDTLDIYHAMDAFVLSSIREGLPNVVLEAMALNVPVLSTRAAGVPNVITDGHNGLLTQCGSSAALDDGLEQLMTDEGLRKRLGDAARQSVVSSHSFALRMSRVRNIYDELLDRPRAEP
jgi:glycosyltransferase involved in cell wall biosynthesis